MGYRIEAGLFSAAECGASHKRERLFVLGYRSGAERILEHATRQLHEGRGPAGPDGRAEYPDASGDVADAGSPRLPERRIAEDGRRDLRLEGDAAESGDSELPDFPPGPDDREQWGWILERWPELAPAVEDAARIRQHGQERQDGGIGGRDGQAGGELADAESRGLGIDGSASRDGGYALFGDEGREEETQPTLRKLADGSAAELGIGRTDQLRALGNMVVPIQGSVGLLTLLKRAGLHLKFFN